MKNKTLIIASTAIALIVIFAVAVGVYKSNETKRLGFLAQENSKLFIREHSPRLGSENAKIHLIEFIDPECESCRHFYPQVKEILKDYKDKVRLIIRYVPFHKNSKIAIAALEASRKQGKYWESIELLFKYQPAWGNHHNPQPHLIFEYLPEVGVDVVKLREDMKSPHIQELIAQDLADSKKLNVRGTPTFFVNGKALENFGIKYLRQAIESEAQRLY